MWRSLAVCIGLSAILGSAAAHELNAEEVAGKRIYLHGQSDSGGEIHARVGAAGVVLPASAMPCAGCHGADGRGRPEGGVAPPDIRWRSLISAGGSRAGQTRRATGYDEAALARAVTEGLDPDAQPLNPAMPRFVLSPRDMARLTAYLKRLEEEHDPGLAPDRLRIGSLLPASGPLAEYGHTVRMLLGRMVAKVNQGGGIHGRQLELVVLDPGPDQASAELALRQLLDEQEVFALLAPLVPALEGHLAEMLGPDGIPVIGSLAQFGEGDHGRSIFSPFPGLREQLLALAQFASEQLPTHQRQGLVVFPQNAPLQRVAEQLAQRMEALGWTVMRHGYRPGQPDARWQSALGEAQAVFFLGSAEGFQAMSAALPPSGNRPYLFASAAQVSGVALSVSPRHAERLFLAYPFVPEDRSEEGTALLASQASGLNRHHGALQVSTYCAALLFFEGMKRSGRNASRQRLVTSLESLHDFPTGLTPALSFGPGARTGAPGAHVVGVNLQQQRLLPLGRYIKPSSL